MVGEDDAKIVCNLLDQRVPGVLRASAAETVFWTGAGISAELPTGAPIGNALADRALNYAFADGTLDVVLDRYQALRLERPRPRLETLLDVVRRVHGLPVLADLLSDLRNPSPNAMHQFFAAHIRAGGRHITANFDPCIELAGTASGEHTGVIHFHGSFAHDPSGEGLGATLASIERGFPAAVEGHLADTLTAVPGLTLIVTGYSGSDFFDVDPFFRSLSSQPRLRGSTVLWVDHQQGPARIISGADAGKARRQLKWLQKAGAEVHQISAPTRVIVTVLAEAWRISPPAPEYGTPHQWHATLPLAGQAREEATLELFALMGLHRHITHVFEHHSPATSREWNIAAQTAWAAGSYREAARAWQRAMAGTSAADRIARCERQGAVQWIRGQYRRAYRTLRQTSEEASALPDVNLELKIQVAETLGRVLVHMRRSPDTRILATRRKKAFVLSHLPDPVVASPRLGTHLRARVRSVRADLGAPREPDNQWQESQAAFSEYEALHAQLNYRHAELRHSAPARTVEAREFRQLRDGFLALGAYGDAARVPLIPGAERAFTIPETIEGIHSVDITRWHRWRLISGYLAQRLLTRTRKHRQ